MIFESSMKLVAGFLSHNDLSSLRPGQSLEVHLEAVRAVTRAPYWNVEDASMLAEFVEHIGRLLMCSIEGFGSGGATLEQPESRRALDLSEAEEVAFTTLQALLQLILIDPSPPTVLHCLVKRLGELGPQASDTGQADAVSSVMRVMEVFTSSDRVQTNAQHLLTSVLGD